MLSKGDGLLLLMLYPSLRLYHGPQAPKTLQVLGNHKSQRACTIQGLCSCSSEAEEVVTAADPGSGSVEAEMLGPSNVSSNSKLFVLHL